MKLIKTTLISFLILPSVTFAQSAEKLPFSVTAGLVSLPNFLGDDAQQITARGSIILQVFSSAAVV